MHGANSRTVAGGRPCGGFRCLVSWASVGTVLVEPLKLGLDGSRSLQRPRSLPAFTPAATAQQAPAPTINAPNTNTSSDLTAAATTLMVNPTMRKTVARMRNVRTPAGRFQAPSSLSMHSVPGIVRLPKPSRYRLRTRHGRLGRCATLRRCNSIERRTGARSTDFALRRFADEEGPPSDPSRITLNPSSWIDGEVFDPPRLRISFGARL